MINTKAKEFARKDAMAKKQHHQGNIPATVATFEKPTAGDLLDAGQATGFFIEYIDDTTRKCYGIDMVPAAQVDRARIVGFYGEQTVTLTKPFVLNRGHKLVTIKASATKPIVCRTHIFPMDK